MARRHKRIGYAGDSKRKLTSCPCDIEWFFLSWRFENIELISACLLLVCLAERNVFVRKIRRVGPYLVHANSKKVMRLPFLVAERALPEQRIPVIRIFHGNNLRC